MLWAEGALKSCCLACQLFLLCKSALKMNLLQMHRCGMRQC